MYEGDGRGDGLTWSVIRTLYIESVPQAEHASCHHGDALTNKPTKHDGRVGTLISPLHNADKVSAGHAIGWYLMRTLYFEIYF